MVNTYSSRKGIKETQDSTHQRKYREFSQRRTQLSRKINIFDQEAHSVRGTYTYSFIKGFQSEQTYLGNRIAEEREEGIHIQRSVSIASFSKRVKEVAELLDNKDKCIDLLKEQVEVRNK
jgi:galactokinase